MADEAAGVDIRPGWLRRAQSRLDGWTPEARQTIRTLISVFLSDVVAHAAHLREPYWALITAVIVTQARISATLEAGRDQILGTLIGAVAGAAAISLSLLGLPKLPVFACLLVPLAVLAAFKPNLRLAGVTLVVVYLFPAQGNPFTRPVDRVLAILVGAAVSLLVSVMVFHARARAQAFQAASAMLDTLDATQRAILTRRTAMVEVERLNEVSVAALRILVAAIEEARRERLGAIDQHEPLMVRLVPMLRRLQSDVLFVARAIDETLQQAGPDATPVPALAGISNAIGDAFRALRDALGQEAATKAHDAGACDDVAATLAGTLRALGDAAGPLPRFTLEMLHRDIEDMVAALDRQGPGSAASPIG